MEHHASARGFIAEARASMELSLTSAGRRSIPRLRQKETRSAPLPTEIADCASGREERTAKLAKIEPET